jgi:hypothetical protein
MAWLGGLFHTLLQGLDLPELPALIVWMAAFSLWILVWPEADDSPRTAVTPGAVLLVGGLGVALWLHMTTPYSPRHPEAVMPLYVVDHDTGKAWRVSPFKPNGWVSEVLRADGAAVSQRRMPTFEDPVWAAPAISVTAQAPDVAVSRTGNGVVSVHAAAPADQVLNVTLNVGSGLTGQASLNGKPLTLPTKPNAKVLIRWAAAPEGFTLSFKPSGSGVLNVGYASYRRQWPAEAKALPALPQDMMDWDMFGSTVVAGTMHVKW